MSPARPVVVDLCCGTGAIGLAVAVGLAEVELYAADVDPVAVACATANLGERGTVFEGDLYAALPTALRGRVDLLLVNAPYVPTDSIAFMPPEARSYEPALALDGGRDGVEVHRRVAADAASWLAPGGRLLIETGRRQARFEAPVNQQAPDLLVGDLADKVFDVDAAVAQRATLFVGLGNLRGEGHDSF